MADYLRKIVKLTKEQYAQLIEDGSITVGGVTYTYNANDLYLTDQQQELSIGTVQTLTPGSDATATITGTAEQPVLNLGIPEGAQGETGPQGPEGPEGPAGADGQDGADGVSPTVTVSTITGGHQITITDADHPSGQTVNVMDGEQGQTGPTGPGVPSGGTAGQVLRKTSGTDYNTEWATLVDDTAGSGDTEKVWSADKSASENSSLLSLISGINDELAAAAQDDTGQEWLTQETYNTGLTGTVLTLIGMIIDNLPQDDNLMNIKNMISLECDRLDAIYNGWVAERT